MLSSCDRMLNYHQLEEHLLAYYRTWQVNLNEYVSKANSEIQRAIIDAHIRNPARSNNVPSHVPAEFQPRIVSAGKLPDVPCIPPVPPAITMRRQVPQISNSPAVHHPAGLLEDLPISTGDKRKADELLVIQEKGEEMQRKRAPKKCWKCDQTGCLGATGKHKCTSACKSCGTFECSGKESRYPQRPCPTLQKVQK